MECLSALVFLQFPFVPFFLSVSHCARDGNTFNLFYDPRSLDLTQEKRACLHAKCVVVDTEKVFFPSANFTEAAQLRNIEVGVLIQSKATANQITTFFNSLVELRILLPMG